MKNEVGVTYVESIGIEVVFTDGKSLKIAQGVFDPPVLMKSHDLLAACEYVEDFIRDCRGLPDYDRGYKSPSTILFDNCGTNVLIILSSVKYIRPWYETTLKLEEVEAQGEVLDGKLPDPYAGIDPFVVDLSNG